VLITRPAGQAGELAGLLRNRGIDSICVPTVEVRHDHRPLVEAIGRLRDASWLVVTSANGAEAVGAALMASGSALPETLRVAAVGPQTAAALRAAGIRVDHVPDRYLTVAIAERLGPVRRRRVVLARADAASPHLANELRRRGALVDEVIAYSTVEGPPASRERIGRAIQASLDGITFTSGSTVRGLMEMLNPTERGRATALPAFCIGPVTADVARRLGFATPVVAATHTAKGLADAIHAHLGRELG
jgi:uroporphyrinogen-III synthase